MDQGPSGRQHRAGGPAPARRANLVALVAIAVLAGLLFWVVSAIQSHNALQNCIDAGRRDCLPAPGE